jgi:NTE family protein
VDRPPSVALALGSGGARGYAHIGAIQVLQERGMPIVGIAGSSMGALVGGLYAAGRLDEYTDWSLGLTRSDLLRLVGLSFSAPGAIKAERFFARVHELLGDVRIEELPIPFTAVASDLLARKEVWFQRGPLDLAIRASTAIPSVITPVVLNGRLLADGGLMNPVPIAPTAALGADLTVAISLNGESRILRGARSPTSESADPRPVEEWGDRFRRGIRALTSRFGDRVDGEPADGTELAAEGDAAGETETDASALPVEVPAVQLEELGEIPAGLRKLDVMNLSIEAMQDVLTRYRLAGNPPEVLVAVPKDACRSLDFHRAAELIELGRTLTTEALADAAVG